jgi:hypothetical protein
MADTTLGTTRAQFRFLKTFFDQGPMPGDWPSPAILRRWLGRAGFLRAMKSVMTALRWRADFQLLVTSNRAAAQLHHLVAGGGDRAKPLAATSSADRTSAQSKRDEDDEDSAVDPQVEASLIKRIKVLGDLLRLAHQRERVTLKNPSLPEPPPRSDSALLHNLRYAHRDLTVGEALEHLERMGYVKPAPPEERHEPTERHKQFLAEQLGKSGDEEEAGFTPMG